MSALLYVIALFWFVYFTLATLSACKSYNLSHYPTRAGSAGFVVWVLLAVLPTWFICYLA